MKVIVVREQWANPNYDNEIDRHGRSELLNETGCMCCLGFALMQCGVPRSWLKHSSTPQSISAHAYTSLDPESLKLASAFVEIREEEEYDGLPYFTSRDTPLSIQAVDTNDNATYTLSQREAALTALFAEYGHHLEFV